MNPILSDALRAVQAHVASETLTHLVQAYFSAGDDVKRLIEPALIIQFKVEFID